MAADAEYAPAPLDLLDEASPWLSGSLEVMADPNALGGAPADATAGLPGGGLGRAAPERKDRGRSQLQPRRPRGREPDRHMAMATEFSVDAGSGHEIQVGAGYGTQFSAAAGRCGRRQRRGRHGVHRRPLEPGRSPVAIAVGARHSYVGFVPDRNHTDPSASVEFEAGRRTTLRGSLATHTLAPGWRLAEPVDAQRDPRHHSCGDRGRLRPERIVRYELCRRAAAWVLPRGGCASSTRGSRDQLVNAFFEGEAGRMLARLQRPRRVQPRRRLRGVPKLRERPERLLRLHVRATAGVTLRFRPWTREGS